MGKPAVSIRSASYLILCLFMLSTPVFALDTYVDEQIRLSETGEAYVIGVTNVDLLNYVKPQGLNIEGTTPELTRKKDKYWLFSYVSTTNITTSIIKVSLPKGSIVNHISTDMQISIESENDIMTMTFIGDDEPLDILVQYSIGRQPSEEPVISSFLYIIPVMIAGLAVMIIILIHILFVLRKKHLAQESATAGSASQPSGLDKKSHAGLNDSVIRKNTVEDEAISKPGPSESSKSQPQSKYGSSETLETDVQQLGDASIRSIKDLENAQQAKTQALDIEKLNGIKLALNDTQLKIMDALLSLDGKASQTKLLYMTGIPKASLSRNLELMSQKEIISKTYTGTSNHIRLHPSLYR